MDAGTSRTSRPIRILLLTGQSELRRMMAAGLRLHGYQPLTASAGQPQLAILHAGPDTSPASLSAELAPWRAQGVPVLVISSGSEAGCRQACLDAGASEYLAMPFELDTLLSRVQACLGAAHAGSQAVLSH
ncbi:MAG: response regulator transcription factor [Anaerolineales bacterium]|nr:response regulator transcription factor [Anaerolineales bacterium]